MEPDKDMAKEAEKSTYKLKSDIDTPSEELHELRASNSREGKLLIVAALFIIALGAILWWMLAR
jgi:hypothetical protein